MTQADDVIRQLMKNGVKELFIPFHIFSDEDTNKVIEALNYNTSLRCLHITKAHLTDETAIRILKTIKKEFNYLNLSYNNLSDKTAKELGWMLSNNYFQALHLGNNKITNKGIKYIAEGLKYNTKLEFLWLGDNKFEQNDVRVFIDVLKTNYSILLIWHDFLTRNRNTEQDTIPYTDRNRFINTTSLAKQCARLIVREKIEVPDYFPKILIDQNR